MKTIVLANQKGGVGRSAVATLLAQYVVHRGQRVLAIDLDQKGHLSGALRLSRRATVSAVTADQLLSTPDVHIGAARFVLVPATETLMALERFPHLHLAFRSNLHNFLCSVEAAFDLCIIDSSSSPDVRQTLAISSADCVLVPVQLHGEAVECVRATIASATAGSAETPAYGRPSRRQVRLLPSLVTWTRLEALTFAELLGIYPELMLPLPGSRLGHACIAYHPAVATTCADGHLLWEMRSQAARHAWKDVKPSLDAIVARLGCGEARP